MDHKFERKKVKRRRKKNLKNKVIFIYLNGEALKSFYANIQKNANH